jgi:CubicO group peptidase (beta-lactamase class C family)
MKPLLTSVLFLILLLNTNCGQTKKESDTSQKIEKYLSALENVGFYGSVLVEINGEKVISKGFGFSDVEKQIKNSPTTVFDIGSITKQFTAAAVLKLEMQGKLSTDDKVSKFFDKLPADKQQITIHDLLRHQSGLISNVGRDFEKISEEEFLDKVFNSKLQFPVGTSFSYSNIGYSILAIIIEKTSKQSYENYLYENLWKPSQMEMTGYTRPAFDKNFIAVGYEIVLVQRKMEFRVN